MDADHQSDGGFKLKQNKLIMNNIFITCLKSEKIETGSLYGRFLINSLNSGQGITVGNLLRRILLNDLGGTSVTGVRIAGIKDEFSTISGVREDILEILLNLKGIIIKSDIKDIQFGRLKVEGPAIITADLIDMPSDTKIINPNHYIASISNSNVLEIELQFEYGKGYKLAGQTFCKKSQDFLQIDAIFMPVQKVDFKTENVYGIDGSVTEQVIIDIWTNGSISPEEALTSASKTVVSIFTNLIEYKSLNEPISKNKLPPKKVKNSHTNIAIEELHLSVRAYNCLKRAQIHTIGDLLQYSPERLQELKNFGRKSADEVFTTLKNKLGIILK